MTKDIYKYRAELVEKLAAVNVVIAGMGGNAKGTVGAPKGPRKRRKMSAAARAKIAAAQRARWAKQKSRK